MYTYVRKYIDDIKWKLHDILHTEIYLLINDIRTIHTQN